jgi:hypothetical protein
MRAFRCPTAAGNDHAAEHCKQMPPVHHRASFIKGVGDRLPATYSPRGHVLAECFSGTYYPEQFRVSSLRILGSCHSECLVRSGPADYPGPDERRLNAQTDHSKPRR